LAVDELHLGRHGLEAGNLDEHAVFARGNELAVRRGAPLRTLPLGVVDPDVRSAYVRGNAEERHEGALREVRLEVMHVTGADLDVRLAHVEVRELVDDDVVAPDGEGQARRRRRR